MKKVDPEPVWYSNRGRPYPVPECEWDAVLKNTAADFTVSMPMPSYTREKEFLIIIIWFKEVEQVLVGLWEWACNCVWQ